MDKAIPSSTTASQLVDALRIVASAAFTVLKWVAWLVSIAAFAFLVFHIARSLGDYLVALDKITVIAIIPGFCFFSWTMTLSCIKMPPENKFLFFLKFFSIAFPSLIFLAGLFITLPVPNGKDYIVLLPLISVMNLSIQLVVLYLLRVYGNKYFESSTKD
ncbi:hypothetical protein [Giesbergeria anulus]|uniref:Uncharacterized protein n=1 Tax=Giesbergeria anulus TaxID=180197 RepID=A0A1H9NRM3_9BURK|nr:hypothetical protein [Giesbergeria anulus]SER38315.1 hypothetical protein SAMN02982919_02308 [Giesbergeria anulus]